MTESAKQEINLPEGAEILERESATASPELAEQLARRGASESLVRAIEGKALAKKRYTHRIVSRDAA